MEEWLKKLLEVSHTSLYQLVLQALDSDLPVLEELVRCQVTQVSCVAIHHQWTRDCEQVGGWVWLNDQMWAWLNLKSVRGFDYVCVTTQALRRCRYDRRALPNLRACYSNSMVNRLCTLVMRTAWKQHGNEPVTSLHRTRLETMIVVGSDTD